MDNEKGEKGKLFFLKYFVIDYDLITKYIIKIIMTELVMDNEKGKKKLMNIFEDY